MSVTAATVSGEAGIVGCLDSVVDFVGAFEVDTDSVRTVRFVGNPDKLRLVDPGISLL